MNVVRRRSLSGAIVLVCSVAALTTATRTAAQRGAPAQAVRPTPRTLDGKPDLSGFWRGPLLRNMDKNVPGGFKAIFTPDTVRHEDGQVVVEGPAHGDFKGSPIRFTYRFTLDDDTITALEITA